MISLDKDNSVIMGRPEDDVRTVIQYESDNKLYIVVQALKRKKTSLIDYLIGFTIILLFPFLLPLSAFERPSRFISRKLHSILYTDQWKTEASLSISGCPDRLQYETKKV